MHISHAPNTFLKNAQKRLYSNTLKKKKKNELKVYIYRKKKKRIESLYLPEGKKNWHVLQIPKAHLKSDPHV